MSKFVKNAVKYKHIINTKIQFKNNFLSKNNRLC